MKVMTIFMSVMMLVSTTFLSADDKLNLLIAVDSSDFKTELSDEISKLAKAESYEITVRESVKKIKDWPLDEFDAVIAINRGMAGSMNRKLLKVLEEGEFPPMVVVTSYADPKTSKDIYTAYKGVDGISTASLNESNEINRLAIEVFSRVKELLR